MNRRTIPLYCLPISFAIFAGFFPDRFSYIFSLLAAIVLYLAAVRIGRIALAKHTEEAFYFPFGLGLLLLIAYCCFSVTANQFVITTLWCAFLVLAFFERSTFSMKLPVKLLIVAPFLLLGFWSCLTPVTFFDALVYHLGLPDQYLQLGHMQVIPDHLYSSFPPFDQVLNLLFVGLHAEPAIKIFSIIILIGLLHCAASAVEPSEMQAEFLVIPFLCIPCLWILVHLVTGDLLTALFFSAGVFLLTTQIDRKSGLLIGAILIGFSCWTKWNVLLYLPFLFILSVRNWARFLAVGALVSVFIVPLLIRNYTILGDPLYPMFSIQLKNPHWSSEQQTALHKDSFPRRMRNLKSIVESPLQLLTTPDDFGSASEIGFAPWIGVLLYPFARKQRSWLLLYIAICFFVWVYLFPNFRQFLPVFVLLIPIIYSGWLRIHEKSRSLAYAAMLLCIVSGMYTLLSIYKQFFPLISFNEKREDYLHANVSYYPIARTLETGRAILVGETRSAYFRVPLVVSTSYDKSPFLLLLRECGDPGCLYRSLIDQQITSIVYNPLQFQQRSQTYGLWTISPEEQQLLQEFVKKYTVPKLRANGIYLLELKKNNAGGP